MEFLDQTLQWATNADSFEVVGFLKTFFNCLGYEELGMVKKIVHRTKSKQEIKARSWKGPRPEKKKNEKPKAVLTPESSVITPDPVVIPEPSSVLTPKSSVITPDLVVIPEPSSVLTPGLSVITPESNPEIFAELSEVYLNPNDISTRWWKQHKQSDFVAFDVEGIDLIGVTGMAKERAGSVTCVDNNGKVLLDTLIKRNPHTFKTNTIGAQIAGFTDPLCLSHGRDEATVNTELSRILSKKIAVMCGAEKDFRLMNLPFNSYKVFGLQWFFKRPNPKDTSCPPTNMSLRDMYFFLFQEDIQPPKLPHSSIADAKATIDVFIKGYCSRKIQKFFQYLSETGTLVLSEEVTPNLKKMEKKGLRYCSSAKKFVPI